MDNEKEVGLLPCPWCYKIDYLSCDGHYVECEKCGCQGPNVYPVPNKKQAVEQWNHRPIPSSKEDGKLVLLDEKKVLVYLLGITPRSVPLDREEIESLAKRLSSKFGKCACQDVTVENIEEILWNKLKYGKEVINESTLHIIASTIYDRIHGKDK